MTPEVAKIVHLTKRIKLMQEALDSCYQTEREGYDQRGMNAIFNVQRFNEKKVAKARGSEITWHPVKKSKAII